jgi:hypothetical protein
MKRWQPGLRAISLEQTLDNYTNDSSGTTC